MKRLASVTTLSVECLLVIMGTYHYRRRTTYRIIRAVPSLEPLPTEVSLAKASTDPTWVLEHSIVKHYMKTKPFYMRHVNERIEFDWKIDRTACLYLEERAFQNI